MMRVDALKGEALAVVVQSARTSPLVVDWYEGTLLYLSRLLCFYGLNSALAKILDIHGVSNYVELHLLHRHFILREGEAMLHKPLVIPSSDGDTSITVDIAKAVPCPSSAKSSL